ncbi:hypothetical protein GALL_443240 [mine drainage metagenome]|uniref:Histidine kinase/HSP90-like ATPase domain-containing protein n=1 Tax=mine drainage metagenome TaxID=410659 RepID=A0A1J5QDL4_9ZZZZ
MTAHEAAVARVADGLRTPELADLPEGLVVDLVGVRTRAEAAEERATNAASTLAVVGRRAGDARVAEVEVAEAVARHVTVAEEAAPVIRMANLATGTGSDNARALSLATFVLVRRFEDVVAAANERLLLMSDGILDSCQKKSRDYDTRWLLGNLDSVPPAGRMAAVRDVVLEQLGGGPAQDDISMFLISTRLLDDTDAGHIHPSLSVPPQPEGNACHLKLLLNGNQLRGINQNVMPFMMEALERLCFQEHLRSTLFLILSELFNNSLDHGLLKLDSRLKNAEDGFERYLEQRASRLEALDSQAFIEIGIEMTADPGVNIMVHDSGSGFDHVAVMQQITETRCIHGRGLMLIRGLGARLEYPGAGNEVRVNLGLDRR